MTCVFDDVLRRFAEQPNDSAMADVAAGADAADITHLARLTEILANSGERLTATSTDVVDIASSGGPGSLSTLLAPLYACALGARVSKIGVPGRPAGGLDVLASLPGYRPDLSVTAARRVLDESGYVHVAAGAAFCPLDAEFFAWRQQNGAQAIPSLAITSLLSKKLAAGVGRFVLDIRVGPHGNFGTTQDEARANATRLIQVAAHVGIQAVCVLTATNGAAQPWIGRGEALVALGQILNGDPDEHLHRHANACLEMALLATAAVEAPPAPEPAERATATHETMLAAHGSGAEAFWSRQRTIWTAPRYDIVAEGAGTFQVDLGEVRRLLVDRQRAVEPVVGARFSDPSGVHLVAAQGTTVGAGAVLARVRDDDDPVHLGSQIAAHLRVVDEPVDVVTDTPMEIVRG